MDRDEGEAGAVGRLGPGRAVAVAHGKDGRAHSVDQREAFALVGQAAAEDAVKGHARVLRGEGRRVAHQHHEAARCQARPGGEGVADTLGKVHAAEVQFLGAHVLELDELELLAGERLGVRRVVHDLGEEQVREGPAEHEVGLVEGAPVGPAQDARLDRAAFVQGDGGGVALRPGRDRAAAQAGVGAVARVVDDLGRGGHGEQEARRDRAAVLVERGRDHVGIKPGGAELVQDDATALGEVVAQDVVDGVAPVRGGEGRGPFGVAPAGRLADHGALDLGRAPQEQLAHALRGEQALVEEMPVDVVGHAQPEFGVGLEFLPEPLGVAVHHRGVAGGEGAEAVFVDVEQCVLGVVNEEPEAVRPGAVAQGVEVVGPGVAQEVGDGRVQVPAVEDEEHVINQVRDIHQLFVGGIARAVGVVALHKLIGSVTGEAGPGQVVKPGPRLHVAVGGPERVRPGLDLEGVEVLAAAAEIGGAVGGLGALAGVVQAPVLAVDVEVVELAPLARMAHGQLQVAVQLVAHEDAAAVALKAPRVVLESAQIYFVEAVRAGVAEERIAQFRGPVFLAEKQPEGVFGIAGAAAESAPDAKARRHLETRRPVRMDQLDRTGPLPIPAVLAGVGVNARGRVEQVVEVHDDGKARQRLEVVPDGGCVPGVVDHPRVHAVVHHVGAPTGRPARRRRAGGRLPQHVVQKQVGVRDHRRGLVTFQKRRGAQHGGASDVQRSGVGQAVVQRRQRPVGGVTQRSSRRATGQFQVKRRLIEAPLDAQARRRQKPANPAPVQRAGGRLGEVAPFSRRNAVLDQLGEH